MLKRITTILFLGIFITMAIFANSNELTIQETKVLDQFFRIMLEQSEGGYVIFDSKPVCTYGFRANDEFIKETPSHSLSVIIAEGAKLLKNKPFIEDNFIIHVYNNRDNLVKNCIHLLFINKKLFLNAVRENLPLFQYVLGPEVTPEKLLTKLTDPNETFHNVMKENRVLIGIILGFGIQNSLHVSRLEDLQDHWFSESPPLSRCYLKYPGFSNEYKKMIFLNCRQTTGIKEPAFGHQSLDEEIKNSLKKISCSSEKLAKDSPNFIFGHIQDKFSIDLITKLEQAQEKIKKLLSSKDFLQETLKLVFPKDTINISTQNTPLVFNQNELNRLPHLVASSIWNNMEDISDEYLDAMLEGMKSAEQGNSPPNLVEYGEYNKQERYQEIKENVKQANNYFCSLSRNQEYTQVENLPLYYRILKQGGGDFIQKPSEILISFSMAYPDEEVIVDNIKNNRAEKLDLNNVIPGFAFGVKGMKINEEREILIHPSLGYGIFTALKKGMPIKVKARLIDIIEKGQNNENPSFNKEAINLEEELETLGILSIDELTNLAKSAGFSYGYNVWEHYKKASHYSLEQILVLIKKFSENNSTSELTLDDNALLNHLHWTIYQISDPKT